MNRRGRIPYWNSMRPRELRGKAAGGLPAAAGLTAAETLDAATGVDQLLTAGVERMAVRADLDVGLRLRRTRGELVAAGTAHVRLDVLGMDVGLHVVEDSRGDEPRTALKGPVSGVRGRASPLPRGRRRRPGRTAARPLDSAPRSPP